MEVGRDTEPSVKASLDLEDADGASPPRPIGYPRNCGSESRVAVLEKMGETS